MKDSRQEQEALTTLAIDTSCDETSCAVVRGLTVLSNVLPSQNAYHAKYGGVVPSLAKLAHEERIDNVVLEALQRAFPGNINEGSSFDSAQGDTMEQYMAKIDQVAVTIGPGLAIALEVGIKKAKELAIQYEKPFVPVNHMEGHLLSAFASKNSKSEIRNPKQGTISKFQDQEAYPVLGVLVSGKHTEFVLVKALGDYEIVGETLDDACGEAFDKAGRSLGLGYPAGGIIADFAKEHRKNMEIEVINKSQSVYVKVKNKNSKAEYQLPIPMARSNDLNFSYSGLKTAFRQLIDRITSDKSKTENKLLGKGENSLEVDKEISEGLSKEQIMDLSVMFEEAAIKPIEIKLKKAIEQYKPKEVWLGGGVVANVQLKNVVRNICKQNDIEAHYPTDKKLTTDNAAMIGVAANLRFAITNDKLVHRNQSVGGLRITNAEEIGKIDRDPTLELGEDFLI